MTILVVSILASKLSWNPNFQYPKHFRLSAIVSSVYLPLPLYLQAVFSTRNLKTRHGVVTNTHPLNLRRYGKQG
jgi:hypothetical protein